MTFRCLLVALVLVGTAGAAPTWRTPFELSHSDRARAPELAVNAAGDAIVVWNDEVGADCPSQPASLSCIHIVKVVSRAGPAGSWSAPVEVARPGVGNAPRVAIGPAGKAALVWIHDIGEDRVLQATIRPGHSATWPNANDLSGSPLEIKNHAIALDLAGNAVAVWAQRDAGTFYVVGDLRVAARGYWEAPVALSSLAGSVSAGPSVAMTWNSFTLAAWIENGQVRVASGDVTTGMWATPLALAGGVGAGADIVVAMNFLGDAVVVWSSAANVVQASARPAGGSWSAPMRIGTGGSPDVVLDSAGNALVVWLGGRDGHVLQSARHSRGAAAWTRPFVVARDASEPRLAMDAAANVVAVWTRGPNRFTRTALRPAALGTWVRLADISASGASGPRVAISARGDATAVWDRTAPPRVFVEGAELTGAGPVLAQLNVPKKALVGLATTSSVLSAAWKEPLAGVPSWRFGDGASAAGLRVSHTYRTAGVYTVTVTARDAVGGVSALTRRISVSAQTLVNTARPAVQGVPRVGRTLNCDRGSWLSKTTVHYTYQWLRNGQPLPAASARLYPVRSTDAGAVISCRVTATNATRSVTLTAAGVRVG